MTSARPKCLAHSNGTSPGHFSLGTPPRPRAKGTWQSSRPRGAEAFDDVALASGCREMEGADPTALGVQIDATVYERWHQMPQSSPCELRQVRWIRPERIRAVNVRVEVTQHADLGAMVRELVDHASRPAPFRRDAPAPTSSAAPAPT